MKKDTQIALREFIDMIKEMDDEELRVFLLDCAASLSGKELDTLTKMTKAIKELYP